MQMIAHILSRTCISYLYHETSEFVLGDGPNAFFIFIMLRIYTICSGYVCVLHALVSLYYKQNLKNHSNVNYLNRVTRTHPVQMLLDHILITKSIELFKQAKCVALYFSTIVFDMYSLFGVKFIHGAQAVECVEASCIGKNI